MGTVTLLFSTTSSPFSWLIRLLTWSRWSHVSVVDGDTIIQAHALHGVIRTPLAKAIANDKESKLVRFKCNNPTAVIAAAASQIGKKYDWTALIGFMLRRGWHNNQICKRRPPAPHQLHGNCRRNIEAVKYTLQPLLVTKNKVGGWNDTRSII